MSKNSKLSILFSNIRGVESKKISLRRIVRKMKPSIVLLNETLLTGNKNLELDPYYTWSKNRIDKKGGGISTSVSPSLKDFSIGVG